MFAFTRPVIGIHHHDHDHDHHNNSTSSGSSGSLSTSQYLSEYTSWPVAPPMGPLSTNRGNYHHDHLDDDDVHSSRHHKVDSPSIAAISSLPSSLSTYFIDATEAIAIDIHGGHLFAVSTVNSPGDQAIDCYDLQTGSQRWSVPSQLIHSYEALSGGSNLSRLIIWDRHRDRLITFGATNECILEFSNVSTFAAMLVTTYTIPPLHPSLFHLMTVW
jgi:hypothetical protein